MGLHIVIGCDSSKPTSRVWPVYVGRDGTAAREARDKDTEADTFLIISNPLVLRKSNHRKVEVASEIPAPEPVAEVATLIAKPKLTGRGIKGIR